MEKLSSTSEIKQILNYFLFIENVLIATDVLYKALSLF